jgi:phosphoribosylformimino-5-aminoimidazole carboxamide ribotide isomerase
MRVWPVLDLLRGVVVRGVAGRRETYRPIQSRLCDSAAPLAIAQALRDHFGLDRLYVADLDGIVHGRGNDGIWRDLSDAGFELMVDAGSANVVGAEHVLRTGARRAIVGLESCPAPADLREILRGVGADRVVFSLDLKDGRPLATENWPRTSSEIAEEALAAGVQAVIVLDLAAVGTGRGVPTLDLCRDLVSRYPGVEWITGGGVNALEDLDTLAGSGVSGALVASALHDGRIPPEALTKAPGRQRGM